jgi:diguanylate cyclase (GGDEF)-like protein
MLGSYDSGLISFSVVIAVITAFVWFDLAPRVAATRGRRAARFWLGGGTLSIGTGIWAMHFIGMLAYSLPISTSYDLPITACSLLVALLAAALALHTASLDRLSLRRLAMVGPLVGTGIATMHYLGMEAMRMQPRIDYLPLFVLLSVLIACATATAGIWIAFQSHHGGVVAPLWRKCVDALSIGAGLSGMHYAGMAAARYAAGAVCLANSQPMNSAWIAGTIGGLTLLILITTLIVSVFVVIPPTIRSRLVFLVMGCVLPVSLMAMAFVFYDYHRGQAQLLSNSVATARALNAMVDKDLASVESALQVLATSRNLVQNNYLDFYGQAVDVLRELRANAITLSDADGQQLIDTRRQYGDALPVYDHPAQARRIFATGRPVISDFFVGNLNREPLITVGVPVWRGKVISHQISASIFSGRLSNILVQSRLQSDWIVTIFDSAGTVVARSHDMAHFVGKQGPPRLLARLAEASEGAIEIKAYDDVPVIAAFSRSSVSNWTVAIGIPTKNFTDALLGSLWWLLLALALLLVSSLTLAWCIGRSIARSIYALTAPALALGTGAKVTVPPLGLTEADEVGKALTKVSTILASVQHEAQHDVLTGLANRALFNEITRQHLMVARRNGGNLAVLYVDLDGFKAVNDTHGHVVGDALLVAVAARLLATIRECDLAARLGGDEFAVVLVQPGMAGSVAIAGKLVESLSAPFAIGELKLQISASIGVAEYPESAGTYETLLNKADHAMYMAKRGGKRRFVMAAP